MGYHIPSLKELFIKGLYEVEFVSFELLGAGHAFPSLEILSLDDMRGWKKWCGVVFPRLQKLQIYGCPNLVEVTLEALPSLNVLKIESCESDVLMRLVQVASKFTKLEIRNISGLNNVVWRGVVGYLEAVEELLITFCNEIRYLVESDADASKVLVKLKDLKVWFCDNLVSLGEKEQDDNCRSNFLTSLRMLDVSYCDNMERCCCPDGIVKLIVDGCSLITVVSFPKGGPENLRLLRINRCRKLLEREWGGQKMNNRSSMRMLEHIYISDWPNLKSIIELNCSVHLTALCIHDCESLESFPDNLLRLKYLEIRNCPSMDASFSGWVWPPNLHSLTIGKLKKPFSEWGPQIFPASLVELVLYDEDGVSSCSQISHILPPSLTSLTIYTFEKLESFLTGLLHLPPSNISIFTNALI